MVDFFCVVFSFLGNSRTVQGHILLLKNIYHGTLQNSLLSAAIFIGRSQNEEKVHWTYRHQGLGDAGENRRTQGVNQDLVLCDRQHQQSGGILGAQVEK